MELLLVRHGQPAWAVDGQSVLDPSLTELGRRQAERLAEHLKALHARRPHPLRLLVSPTLRTRQTAAPLARALGVEPEPAPLLEEIRMNPEWDGAPAEIVGRHLREARTRDADGWWEGVPGGETYRGFHDRIVQGIESALQAHGVRPGAEGPIWDGDPDASRVVLVAHGGTNAVAVGHLLGAPAVPWAWERFVAMHASFTRLRLVPLAGGHIFALRQFSDINHLEPDERTR